MIRQLEPWQIVRIEWKGYCLSIINPPHHTYPDEHIVGSYEIGIFQLDDKLGISHNVTKWCSTINQATKYIPRFMKDPKKLLDEMYEKEYGSIGWVEHDKDGNDYYYDCDGNLIL